MSDPGRQPTDARLSEGVRQFRRAAFELSAPAAGLDVALGALVALAAGLHSPLGQLEVSPLASVFLGEAGVAVAAHGEAPAAVRARRQAAPKRQKPDHGAASASALAGDGLGGISGAFQDFERDVAVTGATESVVPGSGPAAVGIARGVAGLTSLPLIGELAQAALDAIPQPPPGGAAARSGGSARQAKPGSRSATGQFGPAPRAGPLRDGVSAAPASGGDGLGIARAIREFENDVAVGRTAESLVPGRGPIAVPVARGARAAATLLEQLAETALHAVAPHAARPAREPRSDAVESVRRELDAAATQRPTATTLARPVRPRDGASPAPDGARAAEPPAPAELAWLVNEALVEQARRHGVDIS